VTTGTRVSDGRVTLPPEMGGWSGLYMTKTWDGGDRTGIAYPPVQWIKRVKTFYRVVIKNAKVIARRSKPRIVYRTYWKNVYVEKPLRLRNKNGTTRTIIRRYKERVPVRVPVELPGRLYYKILPEKVKLIPKTKVYWKKYRPIPPRDTWGEHDYHAYFVNDSRALGGFQVWDNYPNKNPQHYSDVKSITAEGLAGLPSAVFDWTSNDDIQVINRLRTRLLGSSFHAGNFLVEGKEACNTIADIAERVTNSALFARRGNWKAAFRTLANARPPQKTTGFSSAGSAPSPGNGGASARNAISVKQTAANNWLEWVYGVSPLLSDVKAAAEALAAYTQRPAKATSSVTLTRVVPVRSSSPVYKWTNSRAFEGTRIVAKQTETDLPQLVGLTDFASAAWERMPWSFVADWFLPIGSYLEARGFAQAISGVFITTHKRNLYARDLQMSDPNFDTLIIQNGTILFQYWTLNLDRVVSTSIQVPLPSIVPLAEAVSWKRAANAVALLTQKLKF